MELIYTKRIKKKLKRAISRIVLDNPFFSMILLNQNIIYTDKIPTMGVNGRDLFVNLEFADKLTPDETVGVLIHECMHLCWNHVTRRGNRDPNLWNASCVSGTTQVTLANNSKRAIIDIQPGDYVMSPLGPNKVLGIAFNGFKPVGLLNDTLECTSDHRILTDDGFKKSIYFSKGNKNIFTMSRAETSSIGQPQKHESKTVRTSYWNKIQNYSRIFTYPWSKSRSLCFETNEYATFIEPRYQSTSLYSRYLRWRRNFFSRKNQKQEQQQNLFASTCNNHKHFLLFTKILPKPRILWNRKDKQSWQQVLEHPAVRLQSTTFFNKIRTFISNKTSSVSMHNRAYEAAYSAKEKRPTDSVYVEACKRSKTFKHTKGFFRQREKNIQPVFDLITEKGIYIANDIVVHNCDYTINPVIKSEGFTLPSNHLDEERFHKMTADEIYKILEKEQPDIDPSLMDLNDSGMSEAEKAKIEHQAKVTLAKAAQVAGDSAPEVIRKELGQILEPDLPWQTLLRDFMQESLGGEDATWRRPHRNYIHEDLYIPSSEGHSLPNISIMIDTSGSIYSNQELFEEFAAEINSIVQDLSPEQTDIYYVDTDINKHDTFGECELPTYDLVGGGGTDFTTFFKKVEQTQPACIIVFTDMWAGGMPEHFDTPILWCCYENQDPPENVAGKVIKVK